METLQVDELIVGSENGTHVRLTAKSIVMYETNRRLRSASPISKRSLRGAALSSVGRVIPHVRRSCQSSRVEPTSSPASPPCVLLVSIRRRNRSPFKDN